MRLADLELSSREGVLIAHVRGEIDMSNAAELRDAVAGATSNDSLGVVLDLADVTYVDSAGIQMLYTLAERLRMRGQALRVVIPPDSPASDALRFAGIERYREAVDGVDAGLRELAASAPPES